MHQGAQEKGIGVLGNVHIVSDHDYVDVGGGQTRRALAMLACYANRTVSDDLLIDGIWPDNPPRTALSNLRGFVSKLRRVLIPEIDIERHPGSYLLRVQSDRIDAARFEELAHDAREAARRGEYLDARDLFLRALSLWRGRAYGDLADLPAVQAEAKRLDENRLTVTADFFELELALGPEPPIADLYKVNSEHPLRDRFTAQLMAALYRAGRQAEALKVFQITRETYLEELGLEPRKELRELHMGVLMDDPALIDAARLQLTRAQQDG